MVDFNFIKNKTSVPTASNIDFDFGKSSYNILAGYSNNITAVWADSNTGKSFGRVYIASAGNGAALSILDLETRLLYDRCTTTIKGRANDVLKSDDIEDITI